MTMLMLRIGYKATDDSYQIKEQLDPEYTDVTSVRDWEIQYIKFRYDKTLAEAQVELWIQSLGDKINDTDQYFYNLFKKHNGFIGEPKPQTE